jgi:hypothetical protein
MQFAGTFRSIVEILNVALVICLTLYFASDPYLWSRLTRRRIFLISPWRYREYSSDREHLASSNERRERLSAYLDEPINKRLLETRNGFQALGDLSREQGVAQMVTFRWQAQDPYLLQLARVADLCTWINLNKSDRGSVAENPIVAVSLRRIAPPRNPAYRLFDISWNFSEVPFLSQWCVVVQAHDPAKIVDLLSSELGRIEIGLAVEKPRRAAIQFGACRDASIGSRGSSGRVGGYLEDGKVRGLTCSHVLAVGCVHQRFRQSIEPIMGPDIALIDAGPCFEALSERRAVQPREVTSRDLLPPLVVEMVPHERARGELHEITVSASYQHRLHEFPHAQVSLPRWRLFDIALPRWPIAFSREGDSGSWVVTNDRNDWIGMVVGGTRNGQTGYVVLAHAVMEYLRELRVMGPQTECFIGEK